VSGTVINTRSVGVNRIASAIAADTASSDRPLRRAIFAARGAGLCSSKSPGLEAWLNRGDRSANDARRSHESARQAAAQQTHRPFIADHTDGLIACRPQQFASAALMRRKHRDPRLECRETRQDIRT